MTDGLGYEEVTFKHIGEGIWVSSKEPEIIPEWLKRVTPLVFRQVGRPPNNQFSILRQWQKPIT